VYVDDVDETAWAVSCEERDAVRLAVTQAASLSAIPSHVS